MSARSITSDGFAAQLGSAAETTPPDVLALAEMVHHAIQAVAACPLANQHAMCLQVATRLQARGVRAPGAVHERPHDPARLAARLRAQADDLHGRIPEAAAAIHAAVDEAINEASNTDAISAERTPR